MRPLLPYVTSLLVGLLAAVPVAAQIYKYKDKDGNWQYSDVPPTRDQPVEAIAEATGTASQIDRDLATALRDKFKPGSPVEATTIAVVKVETALGSGSGFFVSETGYLVTNKHVVRPLKKTTDEVADDIRDAEKALARERKNVNRHRRQLKSMKRDLDELKSEMDGQWGSDEKAAYKQRYNERRKRYLAYKKDVDRYNRRFRDQAREFNEKKTSYNRRHANASVARHFTIYFKDDTELRVRLVELSDEHDLALLKLDDYTVPYLELAQGDGLRQGVGVFAVGSPLGMQDYVTSGIVTSIKKDQVIFDAQILPGNSGGPLIDADGKVLGVNTQKILATRSIGSEGFGVAIPVAVVREEFADAIDHREEVVQDEPAVVESSNSLLDAIMDDYRGGDDGGSSNK